MAHALRVRLSLHCRRIVLGRPAAFPRLTNYSWPYSSSRGHMSEISEDLLTTVAMGKPRGLGFGRPAGELYVGRG
jgi:hypothetical protein